MQLTLSLAIAADHLISSGELNIDQAGRDCDRQLEVNAWEEDISVSNVSPTGHTTRSHFGANESILLKDVSRWPVWAQATNETTIDNLSWKQLVVCLQGSGISLSLEQGNTCEQMSLTTGASGVVDTK